MKIEYFKYQIPRTLIMYLSSRPSPRHEKALTSSLLSCNNLLRSIRFINGCPNQLEDSKNYKRSVVEEFFV